MPAPSPPPPDFSAITAPVGGIAGDPDRPTQRELDFQDQERDARLRGLIADIAARGALTRQVFRLAVAWLVGVYLLLLLQGFLSPRHWFALDDSVLLAALGGTTASVIGLFAIVARYLFARGARRSDPSGLSA
jgi:hypothetical protein